MSMNENPFAGQGPVLLDIGGDIGALVVTMPEGMEGTEVEIRRVPSPEPVSPEPVSASPERVEGHHPDRAASHHHQAHAADHHHDSPHLPHVAVVARPVDGAHVHSLVFPELKEGRYELYQRPAGPVELTVSVVGGEVAEAVWPDTAQGPAH